MPKKLLIFPVGGNAREALGVVHAINRRNQEWIILGFLDDDALLKDKVFCGSRVLGGKETLDEFTDAYVLAVPGSANSYLDRRRIIDNLNVREDRFVSIIHPSVVVHPDARIGCNTFLMPNVVVGANVTIGNHCVVLANTVLGHDSTVDDYCCIGSNVSISGNVKIGSNCYVGSGANIRENIIVGEKSLVGLGANVISDVGSTVTVAGNPARLIEKQKA